MISSIHSFLVIHNFLYVKHRILSILGTTRVIFFPEDEESDPKDEQSIEFFCLFTEIGGEKVKKTSNERVSLMYNRNSCAHNNLSLEWMAVIGLTNVGRRPMVPFLRRCE